MKKRILVFITLTYSLGLAFAYFLPLPPLVWFLPILILPLIWFYSQRLENNRLGWLLLIIFFCFGAAYYPLRDNLQRELFLDLPMEQEIQIQGEIVKGPFSYPNRILYELRLPNNLGINLRLAPGDKNLLWPGDQVLVKGRLRTPGEARNPGEFNYRKYLWGQGIVAEMYPAEKGITIKARGQYSWRGLVAQKKAEFQQLLGQTMSPVGEKVARALVFGDKTALEKELKELFIALGIMHLLAVSGLHVGFLLLLAYLLERLLRLEARQGFWLTMILLIFYGALTNFTPSVVRASLMAFLLLWGKLLGRERDFYTALALAGLILLIYNPFYLFQSGFQLSFLAAWSIVYFRPMVGRFLDGKGPWQEGIKIPLAAQLGVLPATAYYFNLISLIGFLTNIILVPIAGLIVIGGLMAFFISLFSANLASFLLLALGALIDFLMKIFLLLGELPLATVKVATPSILFLVVYFLGIIGLREILIREDFREKVQQYKRQLGVVLILSLILIFGWQRFHTKPLEVVFLDVGQGDAIFIRTPKGRNLLLDGGGTPLWQEGGFRVGKEVVVPYLQRRGIKEIDLLISSHPDGDHMQGLEDVLMELQVKTILLPPIDIFGQDYNDFLSLARMSHTPVTEMIAGDRIHLDEGIVLEVLSPPQYASIFTTAIDNNHSLLIRLTYGEISFLFTGDLEIEALEYLTRGGITGPVTFFKVPHHGSKTGYYEPYLEQIDPEAVIFSVGKNNYGHPAPELLEYWQARGTGIHRTDLAGAIRIYTDGRKATIKPFIAREGLEQ